MLFHIMHTSGLRAASVVAGALLIAGAVLRDVTVAFPMVLLGGTLIMTAIIDVSILEGLFHLVGGDTTETRHGHANG